MTATEADRTQSHLQLLPEVRVIREKAVEQMEAEAAMVIIMEPPAP